MQGTAFRSSSIFAPLRSLITHRSQQTAMLSCRAAKVSACVPKPAESAFHVTTPSGERAWVHSSTGERTNSLPTHSHQTQRRGVFPRPRRPRLPGRPYRRRVCRRPHRRCRYDTCCFPTEVSHPVSLALALALALARQYPSPSGSRYVSYIYMVFEFGSTTRSVPSITIPPPTTRQGPDGFSPNPDFVSSVEELFPDKSTKICVGCLSGKRSEAATAALEQAGYLSFE
jgi:hypothetical protein